MATTDSVITEAEPVVTKRGTCPICGVGCFVETKLVAGKPVSIRPDRTAGFPADCPRAGQALDYHDNRERLNYPMKRTGMQNGFLANIAVTGGLLLLLQNVM